MSNAPLIRQYLESLRKSEWYAQDQLIDYQRGLLGTLLTHSFDTVPFYRDRLGHMFGKGGKILWDRWGDIPLLTKQDIRDNAEALTSTAVPENHGKVYDRSTSGSTSEPVAFKQTELHFIARNCLTVRFQEWHGLNCEQKFAEIRPYPSGQASYPEGESLETWASEGLIPEQPGPYVKLNISTPIEQQVDWLCRQGPTYLQTFPTNARAIAEYVGKHPKSKPQLLGLFSISETVNDETRDICRMHLGHDIMDIYSASETGNMAIQCPQHAHYHVSGEAVLLEILDDTGTPCPPNTPGQLIATPFYNFAMPLIRYALNDIVETGNPCPCGRGLPVLNRIFGRTRNMFLFPGKMQVQPDFKTVTWLKYLSPKQWQVAQTGPLEIEIRLVVGERAAEDMDFDGMTAYIHQLLRDDITVRYLLVDEIPCLASGKYEDYVCELKA